LPPRRPLEPAELVPLAASVALWLCEGTKEPWNSKLKDPIARTREPEGAVKGPLQAQ
jgi:hypothetical protein